MARRTGEGEREGSGAAAAIRARALEKRYPIRLGLARVTVLRGIDLELGAGRSLALVGPNGSGKSTLLRLLAGVEAPDAGSLAVFGGSPQERAVRRRIGFLPDDAPWPRELSAGAALDLHGSLHGIARAERRRRASELLERVGLAGVARRALGRYSLGMLRRFGLAAALLHRPELLVLDEPSAGLDAEGHVVLDELLGEERARGTALACASHLLGDVVRFCERFAVLVDGRVVETGDAAEVARAAREHGDGDALLRSIYARGRERSRAER